MSVEALGAREKPMPLIRCACHGAGVPFWSEVVSGPADAARPGAEPPASGGPVDPALLDEIVSASHILAAHGVLDAFGHVSLRHPTAPERFLMSRSIAPALVTTDDILELTLDGEACNARGHSLFLERFIHGEIYRARANVAAIVHSHSPYATAFAVVGEPIPPLVAESAGFLGGAVRVAGYVGLGSGEGPGELAAALASDRAILMPNHGQLAVGEDLPRALAAAIAVEEAARIAWLARAIGAPRVLPDSDVEWMNAFIHGEYGQR